MPFSALTEGEREKVLAWLRDHGLDPANVTENGIACEDDGYAIEVLDLGADGRPRLRDGEIATRLERRPADPPLPWPASHTGPHD